MDFFEGNTMKAIGKASSTLVFGTIGKTGQLVDGADVIMNAIVSPFDYAVQYGISITY